MAQFVLANVERPADDPFEVVGAEQTYVLPHPKSLHYDDIMQLDFSNPARSIEVLLGEDYDRFVSEQDLDGWALEELFQSYLKHYGIPMPGEAGASPRRSSATARPSKPTSRSKASR